MKNNLLKNIVVGSLLSVSVLSAAVAADLPPPPPVGQIHFGLLNNGDRSVSYDLNEGNCGSKQGGLSPLSGKEFDCSNYYSNIGFNLSLNGSDLCSGKAYSGHMSIDHVAQGWVCQVVQLNGHHYAALSESSVQAK